MESLQIVFVLLMGALFAIVSFNKNGSVVPSVAGAVACMLFWAIYNGFSLNAYDQIVITVPNHVLWFEAAVTAFVAAIIGRNNTYRRRTKKEGLLRFIVPAILLVVSIILWM